MDLDFLKQTKDELIDVPLLFDDETGEPTDGFKVVGMNSDAYQDADRDFQKDQLRRSSRRGRGIDTSTATGADEMMKAMRKHELVLVKACIREVYGFASGGVPAVLSPELLDTIFAARPAWVPKVLAEIRMERGFTTP